MKEIKDNGEAMGSIIVIAVFIITATTGLLMADHRTDNLMQTSNCIAEQAVVHQYGGSPYSEGAWQLFAPMCNE